MNNDDGLIFFPYFNIKFLAAQVLLSHVKAAKNLILNGLLHNKEGYFGVVKLCAVSKSGDIGETQIIITMTNDHVHTAR